MVSKSAGMGAALPRAFNVPHVRVIYSFFIERHPFFTLAVFLLVWAVCYNKQIYPMIEDFFIGSVHSREEMIILKFAHLSKFSSEKEFSRGVISSVSVLYSIMKLKTKKEIKNWVLTLCKMYSASPLSQSILFNVLVFSISVLSLFNYLKCCHL